MASPRRPKPSLAERRARRADVEDPAVVLDAALRFLEARARSVAEVRRRLTSAGYREDLVARAIERLGDLGMLDDAAFAAQWVESRDRARPRGERALGVELRRKGIDAATITETLEERRQAAVSSGNDHLGDGGDAERRVSASPDESAARKLLARHAHALARVAEPRARRQRAYALLARNGFSPEIAADLSRDLVAVAAASLEDVPEPDAET
ncbi:MAG: regulatory protein RecX [Chloroflexi bacterium]|nr:regulatory protein RecX [Chloroflexota bacterium]